VSAFVTVIPSSSAGTFSTEDKGAPSRNVSPAQAQRPGDWAGSALKERLHALKGCKSQHRRVTCGGSSVARSCSAVLAVLTFFHPVRSTLLEPTDERDYRRE
jgi:hypothetical protein